MIDTLLDRTIAPGYGKVGLELRKRLPGWPADPPRMEGKVVLVTGAASGIGLACATAFARMGASVLAVARNDERAQDALAQIQEAVGHADVRPLAADVSSLAEIRALVDRLTGELDALDVLVNNAGVMPAQRSHSAEGHELMFATHVLAPFALTLELGELLTRSAPSRVINVSSGGMYSQSLPSEDFESERIPYNPTRFYARTKREEVVLTEMLAERFQGTGVFVHAMHPGWADTKGVQQWLPRFRTLTAPIIRTPEQGADTIVWLGGAPDAVSANGLFWHDRRPRPTHYWIGPSEESAADRRKLWDHSQGALDRSRDRSPAGS